MSEREARLQIPQDTIETIRDRVDIVDVVAQYVDLRRTGSSFKGLCPFHDEKTPSFVVSPEKQIFHCFGCQKGGNVFTFLMEMEGVSFPEAVRALGRRVGVEVVSRDDPGAKERRSRNEAMYKANAFAARLYHRELTQSSGAAKARDYLEKRGIPRAAWTRFGLGFAPDSWDRLLTAAKREGISESVLVGLRLIAKRAKQEGYYDYFRNRIMFPIVMPGGRVIAFGARAMGNAEPKYINSAESPIFAKRRTLYGVDRAREAIQERRQAILVEGYTDVISLHLTGFENTVATCGTAFTPEHATALRRLTQRAILLPDADAAGENAALTSGATLMAAGLEVAVARLDEDEDPDYFQYLNYIVDNRSLSPRDRETLILRIVGGISHLEDRLRYDVITGEIARIFGVEPDSLRQRPRRRQSDVVSEGAGRQVDDARVGLEKLALRLVLEGTPIALEAIDSLDTEDFCEDATREMYNLLDSARESRIDIRSRKFQRLAEEADLAALAAEIALIPLPPGNVEALLTDTIRRIKKLKIRDELTALREKLMQLPSDSEEAVAVAEYYHKLRQALVEL
jgi:DNA primase